MSNLNSVALGIGWVVLAACFLVGLSAAWWGFGELVWRVIPEPWRAAQKIAIPQPRYGDYIPPAVTRKALALMLVLGGPYGWLNWPRLVQHNRQKLKVLAEKESQPRDQERDRG